jgi:hypothetical protein
MDTIDLPRFEDRLWGELEQLFHEPELAPAPEEPRGRRRQYVLAAAGLSAAACLATAVLVTNQGDDSEPKDTETAESTTTVQEAAGDEDALVVIEEPDATTWIDEATGDFRTATPSIDESYRTTESDGLRTTISDVRVDHSAKTFWRVPEDGSGLVVGTPSRSADQIRQDIVSGALTEVGRETVDGRELLRLEGPPGTTTTLCGIQGDPRGFTPEQCGEPGMTDESTITTYQRVMWVEPDTYRPVKETGDEDHDGHVATTTYRYLARTPENLALLEAVVPEGYTEVPPTDVSQMVIER